MNTCLVMTILAADRTGIVQKLSQTVADHGGNWLESRMARMSGQFAGILRVECAMEQADDLIGTLESLEGLSVQITREDPRPEASRHHLKLDVIGNDRPGIVQAMSAAIASTGANLEELETTLESAPMAGHPIFHIKGTVSLPADLAPGALGEAIEDLGSDLAVTIEEIA